MDVCRECCVLSGRGLCDELITRPEESYRLWCVAVCDIETSSTRGPNINQLRLTLRDLLAGGDLITLVSLQVRLPASHHISLYEGWNFNSGNYLFTTDTK